MNLARNLERSACYFPDRPAMSEDLKEISYAEFDERANRVATAGNVSGSVPPIPVTGSPSTLGPSRRARLR